MTSPQPLVMNRLTPVSRHPPSSSCQARNPTACKSLPASGSVRAIAPVTSPRENAGKYSSLIGSSANALIVSPMPWRPKIFIRDASARLMISIAMV